MDAERVKSAAVALRAEAEFRIRVEGVSRHNEKCLDWAALLDEIATYLTERAASDGGEAVGTVVAQAPSMATIVAVATAAGAELESNSETPDMSDVGEPWATFTGAQLFEFVDRILQIAPQPAVPEGFVMVPIEPTEAMISKGAHANSEWLDDAAPLNERRYRDPARSVWQDMLAAAPKGVGRE